MWTVAKLQIGLILGFFTLCGCAEAVAECDTARDYSVFYNRNGSKPFFVVGQNGTCTCANQGFVGSGKLLTGLDENPVVASAIANLTAQAALISALQQTVAAQQAALSSQQAALSIQQAAIAQLQRELAELRRAPPYPAAVLPNTNMSCLSIRASNISAASGFYVLMNPSGSMYRFWCDMSADGGGWTQVWRAPADANSTTIDYFPGSHPIVAQSTYMMMAFVDNTTNALKHAWKFPTPAPFVTASPLGIDYCNYNVINATRLSDGFTTTQILRAGFSTFNWTCDEGCFSPGIQRLYPDGGLWGQICLKSTPVPGEYPSPPGFMDFPMYTGFSREGVEHCTLSNATIYTETACGPSRLFAIFVR